MTRGRLRETRRALALAVLVLGTVAPALAAGKPDSVPGYVDGQRFIDVAGDDTVIVEVSFHGPVLRAITKMDAELNGLVGGLESIHAVILDLEDKPDTGRLADVIRETEQDLLRRGWERLARVRDGTAEVKVLLLTDGEVVNGLVVMVFDREDKALVFANVAGVLDLEAISRLGEELDIPGLDQLKKEMRGGR